MSLFSLNLKLKRMNQGLMTVDSLADGIWPHGATYCGSVASCLTCFQLDNWLSKEIGSQQPSCLDPDEKLPKTSSTYSIEKGVKPDHCCFGHRMHDQLYTSFSTNSSKSVTEGPTNKDILHLLLPNLVILILIFIFFFYCLSCVHVPTAQ
jgi:hypothetical protein